mmetsp:Transcript_10749/g.40223  ORF Transcript_10749/g.40223 Transcript_10749/m.40223 type:complete len:86 (+) Transcript_10749:174-431(+)
MIFPNAPKLLVVPDNVFEKLQRGNFSFQQLRENIVASTRRGSLSEPVLDTMGKQTTTVCLLKKCLERRNNLKRRQSRQNMAVSVR